MSQTNNKNVKVSKFCGTLLGALIGDCCGETFQFHSILDPSKKLELKYTLDTLCGPFFEAQRKKYTDDTAMTKSVAKTLIDKQEVDQKELARNFVAQYFKEPNRDYGGGVIQVFDKLKENNCEDILTPAQEQFHGMGSYGNGAAMRISPIPIFYFKESDNVIIEMTKKTSEITHTHNLGINGAILQALAIHIAVQMNPKDKLNVQDFVSTLKEKMEKVETNNGLEPKPDLTVSYCHRLNEMSKLLSRVALPVEVINTLGNSVCALYSVPTAIYCFLRATSAIPEIETDNPFRRAIEYAISLGGDTDTIASMTGAISGAYFGDDIIPKNLILHCEGHKEIINLANQLYEISNSETI